MAVIATPADYPKPLCCDPAAVSPPLASVPCDGQSYLSAAVSTVNGKPLLTRTRAISIQAGQDARIDWCLHDRLGNPVSLGECLSSSSSSVPNDSNSSEDVVPEESNSSSSVAAGYSVKLRVREELGVNSCDASRIRTYDATIQDAATGCVRVTIPAERNKQPGVYFAEMGLVYTNEAGEQSLLFSNVFYLIVNKGLWEADNLQSVGPPTIAEIRLHLRDSGSEESFLLDNLRFDDAEIAASIARPIHYWNEIPPPVTRYNTQNFPFRYHWLEAICGNLFLMAAEQFRANNLKYSAGGVSVDDQDKEPNYEAAAQRRLTEWKNFVTRKKVEINISLGFGSFGSPYGYR